MQNRLFQLLLLLLFVLLLQFCTRKEIEFGTIPENGYTNIVNIDTVTVQLSSVVTDSFTTSNITTFLAGRYSDSYLGAVTAKPFFQLTVPTSLTDIPASAIFDSLTFLVRPNHYYYGDTTISQTFYIHELANAISYSYNNQLYNTSSVAEKPVPLGSKTFVMRPNAVDSISIRLNDEKGRELFAKLQQQSTDITTEASFLNYFYGVSIGVGTTDTSAVYGLTGTAGSMVMRVHYHTTIPYPESKYVDFASLANGYAFNQILTKRPASLTPLTSGLTEIPSALSNGLSFAQPGTGLFLKMTFPSLRSLISNNNITKLLKAELIIRPSYLSFDKNKYRLPTQLFLTTTDNTNVAGSSVLDSTLTTVQYADPVTDDIYGENNFYRFNITSYISQMMFTSGSEGQGFFVTQNAGDSARANRLVVNSDISKENPYTSQLLLSVLTVNK